MTTLKQVKSSADYLQAIAPEGEMVGEYAEWLTAHLCVAHEKIPPTCEPESKEHYDWIVKCFLELDMLTFVPSWL